MRTTLLFTDSVVLLVIALALSGDAFLTYVDPSDLEVLTSGTTTPEMNFNLQFNPLMRQPLPFQIRSGPLREAYFSLLVHRLKTKSQQQQLLHPSISHLGTTLTIHQNKRFWSVGGQGGPLPAEVSFTPSQRQSYPDERPMPSKNNKAMRYG